jgi:hypothetical protein
MMPTYNYRRIYALDLGTHPLSYEENIRILDSIVGE